MLTSYDLLATTARQHIDGLVREASQHRMVTLARRARHHLPEAVAAAMVLRPEKRPPELVGPASRLAPCEPQQANEQANQRSGAPAATASAR